MVFKIILFNLLNGIVDYYVNLSMTEEIQYRRIIIKNILIFIFYYLWDLFYVWNGNSELSLNLSGNEDMKSEIRMESGLIKNDKYV